MSYRIESSVTIQAPPEAVWALAQDVDRRLEWDARIESVRLLTPRPVQKGARTHLTYRMLGMPMAMEIELISWAPPRRSAVRGAVAGSGETIAASWNFEANADGSTTWTTRIVITGAGPLARLREVAFGLVTAHLTRVSQHNLRRLAEAERSVAAGV